MALTDLSPQQALAAKTHDRHVLVAAGAGSGKTRTVVGRILWLLGVEIDGETIGQPIDLSELAAITFTNKAAADIKLKLREALRDAGRREEAYAVDTARVGTIHAFCGEVLREFALRRDHNPTPTVLEDAEATSLMAEVTRDAMVDALDTGAVKDLDVLFARHAPKDVRGMVERLIAEGDRLNAIAANVEYHESHERVLLDLAQFTVTRLEDRLDELGAVDFDRMITWTRDLLRDDDYARETLQHRIHTLIVDEFQDVDPVQREIAYLLGDPKGKRPDTTRLMLVGDAKQSIYRFRRADVSVWRAVEREFRGGWGEVIPLNANYRSTAPILDFVDVTIGKLLDRPLDGAALTDYEVPFAALQVGEEQQRDGPPVELIVIPTGSDGKDLKVDLLRPVEAHAMAQRARELHDEGVKWGDMAVLLSGWGAAPIYQAALEAVGAPTYVIHPSGFYARQEVLDLLVALQAIHDPLDDRAVIGFLRSPFVAVKDETLLAMRKDVGYPPYWPKLEAGRRPSLTDPDEAARLERGVRLLEHAIALRDRISTDRLMRELVDESGYTAHLALLGEEGERALANLRKLFRIARGLRRSGLGEFLHVMQRLAAEDTREGEAPLRGEKDDVVTISTIHSAKGLEWPVVFWCDTVRKESAKLGDPLLGRDRLALKDPELESKDQPERWQTLKQQIALEERAEDTRLWYVATTRAMERLVISGLPLELRDKVKNQKGTNNPASYLWQVLPEINATDGATFTYQGPDGRTHEGVVRVADVAAGLPQEQQGYPDPKSIGDAQALAGPNEPIAVVPGSPRHSASEMLAFARCAKRHWFKYVMGLREPPIDRSSDEFISAVDRGNIVHDVLEHLREEDELDALLEDAIGRWDDDAPPPDSREGVRYREHLREEVEFVAQHADYRAVAALPNAKRELPFLHVADGGHFYRGAIDLAARSDDGYVLLDVKAPQCDAADAAKKAQQYAPQRDVYVRSAEQISGESVERFAFQFSRAQVQIGETITDDLRSEIANSLRERLEAMGSDAPALTEHPWECRWCGYHKVGWCAGVGSATEATETT